MSLKKLAGETAIYGVSSILGRVMSFALVPLYTNEFAPSEYGIVTQIFSLIFFAMTIFTYRMELAYFRFGTDKNEDRTKVFRVTLSSLVFSTMILSALGVILAPFIADFLLIPERVNLIYLGIAIVALDTLNEIPKAKLRLDGRPLKFAFVQLTSIFLNLGIVLFFVWFSPKVLSGELFVFLNSFIEKVYDPTLGISYIFIANVVSSGIAFLLLLPEWKSFKLLIDKELWKRMMTYSLPMVIVGLSFVINELFDRLYLPKLLLGTVEENQAQLGIYGANYKLAVIMALFTQAFRYGAEPFFFKQKGAKDSLKSYANVAKYFFIIGITAFLTVTLFIDLFKHLLRNPVYWEGLHVVPILLLANLCLGMYYNFSVWFKITDRTKFGAYISGAGAVVTVALNFWWIPIFGYTGSAWATLICYASMSVACVVIGRNFLKIPYDFSKMAGYLILGLAIYLFAAFAENWMGDSLVFKLGLNTVLLGLFLGIVWLFEKKELGKVF